MGGSPAYCSCSKTENNESQLDLSTSFSYSRTYEIDSDDLATHKVTKNGIVYNGQIKLGKKHGYGK